MTETFPVEREYAYLIQKAGMKKDMERVRELQFGLRRYRDYFKNYERPKYSG